MNKDVFNYKHDGVIKRFKREYPELQENAEIIFQDLMRFFWASKKLHTMQKAEPDNKELDFLYIMDEEMKAIDQMWHIFLLYTKDYMDFCQKYFGEYLHHLPDIVTKLKGEYVYSLDENMHDVSIDQEKYKPENFALNLERFLNFTFDHLGEDVVRRWYAPYVNV